MVAADLLCQYTFALLQFLMRFEGDQASIGGGAIYANDVSPCAYVPHTKVIQLSNHCHCLTGHYLHSHNFHIGKHKIL